MAKQRVEEEESENRENDFARNASGTASGGNGAGGVIIVGNAQGQCQTTPKETFGGATSSFFFLWPCL